MPDILDYIEKTIADGYRKEIDQEENVWRTLPFFIAALSLEVAELTQLRDQLTALPKLISWVAWFLGAAAFTATVAAIFYLYRSIRFAEFKYLAREPDLLSYAADIQAAVDAKTITPAEGMTTLKKEVAEQYAASVDNNRAINHHRVAMRTVAGVATLASLLAIPLLGAVIVGTHLWRAAKPPEATSMANPLQTTPAEQADLPERRKPELPAPPPMRVVRKGLFTLRETTQTTVEAERENDQRYARARR